MARVTLSLPDDLVQDMDRRGEDRSRFVEEAVRHELENRRNEDLALSLNNPHDETVQFVDAGLEAWGKGLPEESADALVDPRAGSAIHWAPGEGWIEG